MRAVTKEFHSLLRQFLDFRKLTWDEIFELKDAAGVGATLEELTACVLTKETEKGG